MTSWAIVIGINQYPSGSGLHQLKGAVADAAEFADWVLSMGDVSHEHLLFWTYPSPTSTSATLSAYLEDSSIQAINNKRYALNRAPTAAEIRRATSEFAKQAFLDRAERLYVFFAGHGGQVGTHNAAQDCFIAGDYIPNGHADGLVPLDHMLNMLQRHGPKEIIMFLDCCRNTLPDETPDPGDVWSKGDFLYHERFGRAKSAQGSDVAYEVPISAPSRGAFSQVLVDGLRSYRVNGSLTLRDLERYVLHHIKPLVHPYYQRPYFEEVPLRDIGLTITNEPALMTTPEVYISFDTFEEGSDIYLLDGNFNLIRALKASTSLIRLELPYGLYVISTLSYPSEAFKIINHSLAGQTHVI